MNSEKKKLNRDEIEILLDNTALTIKSKSVALDILFNNASCSDAAKKHGISTQRACIIVKDVMSRFGIEQQFVR